MFAMNNTAVSDDWPMTLEMARKILEGKAGLISQKEAVETVFKEINRLNGVVNTQARVISDVRNALR